QPAHWYLKLRFPHISSCEIKHLLHQGVEEGARMGHASR
ncbi:transposase, partial [Xanthomonas oryzae pv. oryzae]